ncbi:MAG: BatA domain-containing protein [Fuerstiella sp.]
MSFLQPFILFALPLIALPILIHLINQNRHRTVHWAATMFLMQAKRMARGMARLRYLLLMLMRMLAIAGLIFALSRPMAGGWLGLTASDVPETTIIVLDRSVSMEEQDPRTGESKRSTALEKLTELVRRTESGTRVVLFDSATREPLEITSIAELSSLPAAGPTSTTANIPALLQQVSEFITNSESGRTDIWVCSDLRHSDWSPTAGRWETIRREFTEREGVRLFMLTYPQVAEKNVSVRVRGVHRRETLDGAELVMDIHLQQSGNSQQPHPVQLTVIIDGARSQLNLEMTGPELIRNGHTIPLDRDAQRGWGRVELPLDANVSDNVFNFVYAEAPVRKTVIVSDDDGVAEMLRLATATPVDSSLIFESEILPSASANAIPWEETALVLWQAALPDDLIARQLADFVDSGRCVVFFPPEADATDDTSAFGAAWGSWRQPDSGEMFRFRPWRTDADLLANSQSGTPLPVGQVECYRVRELQVENESMLWQTESGLPLLTRMPTTSGGVWFCSTLPTPAYSSFVSNGITYYVMLQRALARGSAALGKARQLEAGALVQSTTDWNPLDPATQQVLVSQRSLHSGLYESGDRFFALNRPEAEDNQLVVTDETLEEMLSGVDYTRIDDQVGGTMTLASEVWRTFLLLMIFALLAEALLCVPEAPEERSLPELKPESAA